MASIAFIFLTHFYSTYRHIIHTEWKDGGEGEVEGLVGKRAGDVWLRRERWWKRGAYNSNSNNNNTHSETGNKRNFFIPSVQVSRDSKGYIFFCCCCCCIHSFLCLCPSNIVNIYIMYGGDREWSCYCAPYQIYYRKIFRASKRANVILKMWRDIFFFFVCYIILFLFSSLFLLLLL